MKISVMKSADLTTRSLRAEDNLQEYYTAANGTRLRVTGNNLLIRVDPLPKESRGGIIIPGDACLEVHNTGVVVAKGFVTAQCADKTPIPGINVGDRVLFIRFLAKQDSNIRLQDTLGEDIIRARPSDIVLIFGDEDLVQFRPDLVPERQLNA